MRLIVAQFICLFISVSVGSLLPNFGIENPSKQSVASLLPNFETENPSKEAVGSLLPNFELENLSKQPVGSLLPNVESENPLKQSVGSLLPNFETKNLWNEFMGSVLPIFEIENHWKQTNAFVQSLIDNAPKSVAEDARLHVPELLKKYGYPVETHHLTTSDGYMLQIHRIPCGRSGPSKDRPIVYLQHGLLDSSAGWIIAGPENGLGYILADEGYDVWMGNARGNRYSRNQTIANEKQYWDFSFHEIGTIDVPETIDYILNLTNQEQLDYIGHSQGTTVFYVMCSELPQYNKKIRTHISFSPVAYMSHLSSPLCRFVSPSIAFAAPMLRITGPFEFQPNHSIFYRSAKLLCNGVLNTMCSQAIFMIVGFNQEQFNATILPIFLGHTPAGSSTKQFLHYIQEIQSGKFVQYDYGYFLNPEKYGSFSPPKYDLRKIVAPVYLFYSRNDLLSAEIDVLKLSDELPNVKGLILVDNKKWNHIDYLYGKDAPTLIYKNVLSILAAK